MKDGKAGGDEAASRWPRLLNPIAEGIAQQVMVGDATTGCSRPTLLMPGNRSAGRDGVPTSAKRPAYQPAAEVSATCRDCGQVLDRPDRTYCDDDLPQRRVEAVTTFSMAWPQALAELRVAGSDSAHGGAAEGTHNAAHVAAVVRWDREHDEPANPDMFAREILPRLQGVPLHAISEATGLSAGYCSFVRQGQKVPQRRHWAALAGLSVEHRRNRFHWGGPRGHRRARNLLRWSAAIDR